VAQNPLARPLAELDLGDELRLDEAGASRRLGSREGARSSRARLELPAQALELSLVEARADTAGARMSG
jgi:hypothetical protein